MFCYPYQNNFLGSGKITGILGAQISAPKDGTKCLLRLGSPTPLPLYIEVSHIQGVFQYKFLAFPGIAAHEGIENRFTGEEIIDIHL